MITKVTEGRVRELRSISNVLYNKLNDWIIESLKEENNFILTSVDTFKEFIKNKKLKG